MLSRNSALCDESCDGALYSAIDGEANMATVMLTKHVRIHMNDYLSTYTSRACCMLPHRRVGSMLECFRNVRKNLVQVKVVAVLDCFLLYTNTAY